MREIPLRSQWRSAYSNHAWRALIGWAEYLLWLIGTCNRRVSCTATESKSCDGSTLPLEDVNKSMPLIDVELEKVGSGSSGKRILGGFGTCRVSSSSLSYSTSAVELFTKRSMFEPKSFELRSLSCTFLYLFLFSFFLKKKKSFEGHA